MPKPHPFDVAPLEAIAFLRRKLRVPTERWTDLWQAMHSRAFMVAGAQSDALLTDFHDAVLHAIAEGRTLEQFRADFDRIVKTHGWSYRGGRNWRSKIIFQTNMRTAYAAGRWEQIQRLKEQRPYLRYVAVMDERTRPEHAAWHGTVLHVDDPWWQTHFPPNGWNCRCSVMSLSQRDLDRYGFKISPHAPPSPLVERTINTADGPKVVQVPEGIDPGFAYRPGAEPTPDELGAILERAIVRWAAALSWEEQLAVQYYKGSGYSLLNRHLRGIASFPDVMKDIATLDRALSLARVGTDLTVYRGISPSDPLLRARVGQIVTLPAFTSTSLRVGTALEFGSPLVEIAVPAGYHGAGYVQRVPFLQTDELELLFRPGSRFRVVSRSDDRIVLEAIDEPNRRPRLTPRPPRRRQ